MTIYFLNKKSFIYCVLFIRILIYLPMIKNVFCKPVYTVKIVWPALIIFICIFIRKEKRISVALFFLKVYWTRNSDLNVKNTPKARKTLFAVFKEKKIWIFNQSSCKMLDLVSPFDTSSSFNLHFSECLFGNRYQVHSFLRAVIH